MSFKLKFFFTFVVFSVLVASFSVYSFSKISEKRQLVNKVNSINELLKNKEDSITKTINNIDNHLYAIIKDKQFRDSFKTKTNEQYINNLLKTMMLGMNGVFQIQLLDNNGNEFISQKSSSSNKYLYKDVNNQKLIEKKYIEQIKIGPKNIVCHSKIGVNIDKNNLNIVEPILVYGLNFEEGVLIVSMSLDLIKDILKDKYNQLLLVDNNGNIILDSQSELSWMDNKTNTIELKTLLDEENYNFLKLKEYNTNRFSSIKLKAKNQDKATLILLHPNFELIIEKEMYYIYIFLLISIIIFAMILAYFFSKPMIKLAQKLENVNKDLDLKVSNRTRELNESLQIIDKYVIRSITDTKGIIKNVSEAFCDISQYSKEELIGKPHSIVRHPDMKKEVFEEMWKTIKSGKKWNGKVKNLAKDGTFYWVNVNIEPNYENGKVVSYTAIRSDISDKMLLVELNKSLENKIKVEVEKSREQLETIQKEQLNSEKLNSIITLAAGITHEINTPLTYIKGNFELMKYDIEDLPQSDIKSRMIDDSLVITDGINRISNIIEAMREVSQSSNESEENTNVYSTLITSLIICNNNSNLISRIYVNNKLFSPDLSKNEYEFFSLIQPQRIEQVWIIIINNALDELVKIEDYEKRRLDITIFNEANKIVIEFKDNAGGIDMGKITEIFDPFVSTKEKGGVGIGLNIAKKIVDSHDGSIVAKNCENGAIFRVELPLVNG